MNIAIQNEVKAIEMRRLGLSLSDIAKELKVSKSSVSNWLKNIKLTESEKLLLKKTTETKMHRARMKASISLRSRILFKDRNAFDDASREFKKLAKDPFFNLGLGLYLAKGSMVGGNIQFSHSNQILIEVMLKWFGKYLNLPRKSLKYRLFNVILQKSEENKAFWVRILRVPEENFQKSVYKNGSKDYKNMPKNNGSLSILCTRTDLVRKIIAWQKLLIGYYS